MSMRVCIRTLSLSLTVQLHSDAHRQTLTSIAAVLLQFVTYLLTPSCYQIITA
jgi:hypothetical protein